MRRPLFIVGSGAVTAVGLTTAQTCAAIRARISGFSDVWPRLPPDEPVVGAIVPARRSLKESPRAWLLNLALRALRECLVGKDLDPAQTALLLALPEGYRDHPALRGQGVDNIMLEIESRLGLRFHGASVAGQGGGASAVRFLVTAQQLCHSGIVQHCAVGGVDSLVNSTDTQRLHSCGRLYAGAGNSQGVLPGEGAGFLLLSDAASGSDIRPLAQIVGIGTGQERDTVLGERYSTGVGLRDALEDAVRDAVCKEADIVFRVSDMNGERYRSWESTIGATRFYRTPRGRLVTWYPASSVGDVGAASGILTIRCCNWHRTRVCTGTHCHVRGGFRRGATCGMCRSACTGCAIAALSLQGNASIGRAITERCHMPPAWW